MGTRITAERVGLSEELLHLLLLQLDAEAYGGWMLKVLGFPRQRLRYARVQDHQDLLRHKAAWWDNTYYRVACVIASLSLMSWWLQSSTWYCRLESDSRLLTCTHMQGHAQPSMRAGRCRHTVSSWYLQAHADTRSTLDTSQWMLIHSQFPTNANTPLSLDMSQQI